MQEEEEQDGEGETVMETRREGNGDCQRRGEREKRRSQRNGRRDGRGNKWGKDGGVSDVTASEDDNMEKVGEVRKRPKYKRHSKRLEKVKKKTAK